LIAYEEAAERANNPDGAWSSSSLLMFKGHAFVDVYGQIAWP
jgi:hypothetical protein